MIDRLRQYAGKRAERPTLDPSDCVVYLRRDASGLTLCRFDLASRQTAELAELSDHRSLAPWDLLATADGVFLTKPDESGIERITETSRTSVVAGEGSFTPWDYHPERGLLVLRCRDDEEWTLEDATNDRPRVRIEYPPPVPRRSAGYSPDGARVALAMHTEARIGGSSVVRIFRDSTQEMTIGPEDGHSVAVDWHPTGDVLLIGETSGAPQCVLYSFESDRSDTLGHGTPVGFLDENHMLVTRDGSPVVLTMDGAERSISLPDGASLPSVNWPEHVGRGWFVFLRQGRTQPSTICRYVLDDAASERIAGSSADGLPSTVRPTEETYRTPNGEDAPVLVYRPLDDEQPTPAVVRVYGGRPSLPDGYDGFSQFLCAQGYTVVRPISPDPPWTVETEQNFTAAGRWVADLEGVDGARVGVTGQSQGGYDALMQVLQHPAVWACAVARAPITDLLAFEAAGIGRYLTGREHVLGDLDEHADRWKDRSPISYAADLRRPLLMIHGSADANVPVAQSRRFREQLPREARQRFLRYRELDGFRHDLGLEGQEQSLRFFDRHVGTDPSS